MSVIAPTDTCVASPVAVESTTESVSIGLANGSDACGGGSSMCGGGAIAAVAVAVALAATSGLGRCDGALVVGGVGIKVPRVWM